MGESKDKEEVAEFKTQLVEEAETQSKLSNNEQTATEHLQDTKSVPKESEITNKENEDPRKISNEIAKDNSISSPIVVRRKTDQTPSTTRNDKCISDTNKSNIPTRNKEEIPDDELT